MDLSKVGLSYVINPSYQGNSVVNNSFNGVKSKNIEFTKMHCIFCHFTLFLILSMIIRKPCEILKGASFVYTVLYLRLYSVNII